jgi:uncharacterized membrane protein
MDPTQFATAYALSTSIGIRPFLTLALASLAMHFGYLHPSHPFAYLGSNGATITLAVLAVLEFVGEKIPVVDHTLHMLHFASKPIAAALLVGSAVPEMGPGDVYTYALMGAGALNALGVHTGVATLRGVSSATTLGVANPFVSLIEDAVAAVGVFLAFLAPILAAALAVVITILLFVIARALVRQLRTPAGAVQTRAG